MKNSLADLIRDGGGVRAVELHDGSRHTLSALEARLVTGLLADAAVSPEVAAQMLGVSRPTVLSWMREGILIDEPVGTHHRITTDSIAELKSSRASAGDRAARRMRVGAAQDRSVDRIARREPDMR